MVRIDRWALAVIADRGARGVDAAVERRVGNGPVAPDLSDQLVLADEAVALLDQKKQQIEHLWLQGNTNPVPAQLAQLAVKLMIFKAKSQTRTPVPLLKQKSGISQAKDNHPQKS